jgi:TubC N-terminal docking domain
MTADELLTTLHALSVTLSPRVDRLHVDAPEGVLTAELRLAIRTHKGELLSLLAAPPPEPLAHDTPCRVCDRTDRWNDAGV